MEGDGCAAPACKLCQWAGPDSVSPYIINTCMYTRDGRDSISVDTSASFRATWIVDRHGPCSNLYELHIMSFSNSSLPGDHLS